MINTKNIALQDLAAPDGVCFGCGSANGHGLQIKSYWHEDKQQVVCHYTPSSRYVGWPELVYGGLLACLVDCHSNWTAMAHHYAAENREASTLPRIDCVTAELSIKYIAPTPMGVPLTLLAKIDGPLQRKTSVICDVYAGDVLTAVSQSRFARVDIGHLAKTAQQKK